MNVTRYQVLPCWGLEIVCYQEQDMLNCFFMIIIRVFKQDEFLELSRVASGTFGSVVKVSKQSLVMVDGTVYVRANIYLTFH